MDAYEYTEMTLPQRRETTRGRIQELEAQRFGIYLNKLANGGNPNVDQGKAYDEPMKLTESGIAALRRQLQELDDQLKAEAPAEGQPTPANATDAGGADATRPPLRP